MKIIKEKIFKTLRRKKYFFNLNIKLILLILIYISIDFYLIGLQKRIFKQNINPIRSLNDDNDPRSKGPNQNCMTFKNNDLFTLFNEKGKVDFPDDRITLSLCENIDNIKSSCILKNGIYIIRLAGDINGENNNKNKFEIYDGSIKIYLAAGDICNDQEKYKVDLTIEAVESSEQDKFSKKEDIIKYSESGCHYSIEIKQNYAIIYSNYYGYNLIFTVSQIIMGIILVVLGIYIKICTLKDIVLFSSLIINFISAFFPISIIFDLFRFYLLLACFVYVLNFLIFCACRCYCLLEDIVDIEQSKKYNIFL